VQQHRGSMIVGGERVEPYNDQHFTAVRQRYGCSEEDLAATEQFAFSSLDHGGGKGGDLLA
jgi:hypothetical protein